MQASTAELELLTFLTDENSQARQVAAEHVASFSAQGHPKRFLLTQPPALLKGINGKAKLVGRDGKPCDPVAALKSLCKDQPIAAHDAFSALINLTDSALVANRIGDKEFLSFLVSYIADPISLLADLACMLLSNLTKFEPIAATLLTLQVQAAPFYNFMPTSTMNAMLNGLDADPSAPDYAETKRKADEARARIQQQLKEQEKRSQEQVPALSRLLDAFEEGSTVDSNESALESMKRKVQAAQRAQESEASGSQGPELGPDGRPAKMKRKSNCNFLASVFANVTLVPAGREWFVKPLRADSAAASQAAQQEAATAHADAIEYPTARIMVFTEHPDLIRRGGVISALKNILFIKSSHLVLVAPPSPLPEIAHAKILTAPRPSETLDLLPYLLLPLCDGSELAKLDMEDQESLPEACQLMDEGKKRERDPALRLMLIESLLLLCTGLYGRECLRHRGAYIVVREAHLREEDEQITEAVVRLVNILKRDESDHTLQEMEGYGDAEKVAGEDGEEAAASAETAKVNGSSAVAAAVSSEAKLPGEIDVGATRPPGGSAADVGAAAPEDDDDEDMGIEEL